MLSKADNAVPRIAVEPFQELHGMRACMLAPTKIIAGLGMSLGIERLTAEGATGEAHGLVGCAAGALQFTRAQTVRLCSLTMCGLGAEHRLLVAGPGVAAGKGCSGPCARPAR